MGLWLITYSCRKHRRNEAGAAIFLDYVRRDTYSEVIDTHPVDWFEEQQAEWAKLQKFKHAGEAVSDLVVTLAIAKRE